MDRTPCKVRLDIYLVGYEGEREGEKERRGKSRERETESEREAESERQRNRKGGGEEKGSYLFGREMKKKLRLRVEGRSACLGG